MFVLCHGVCVMKFIASLKVVIIMKYLSIIGTGDKPWIYLRLQVAVCLHLVSLTREKLSKKCQWPLLRSRTAPCLIFLASSDMQKTSLNPCGERATPLTDQNGKKKKYFLKLVRLRSNLKREKCPLPNGAPEHWILYDRSTLHKR